MGWLATDRYVTDQALQDAARGRPFVDEHGALRNPMNESQRKAFLDWATRPVAPGDPLEDDYLGLAGGTDDLTQFLPVMLEHRYRAE